MKVDKAMAKVLRAQTARSRTRAAKAGIIYALPDDYASLLYERQQGRCDVTGLLFSMRSYPAAFVEHPFAPSLDRKDSHGGYTVDNVRLVRVCVNFGMGQWGQEAYLSCARAAVEHARVEQMRKEAIPTSEWHACQRDRIAGAEETAKSLTGVELSRQRRHIASLKRNLTLGPEGLSRAAQRALETSRSKRPVPVR